MKKFACEKCEKSFSKKSNLVRHMNTICFKQNIDLDLLNVNELDSFDVNVKLIGCDFCHKIFNDSSKLKIHLRSRRGDCYKLRNKIPINSLTINNNQKIINKNYIKNIKNINNNNIAIQPIIKNSFNNITIAKHGEETISHITKDVMLKLLDNKSFTKMCTELIRLLYFNDDVPENKNWSIVYPRNKIGGLQLNRETNKFERVESFDIINDKFENMVDLLLPGIQKIYEEDQIHKNLNENQRRNIYRFTCLYKSNISEKSKEIYDSVKKLAYDERRRSMTTWKEKDYAGNHLSLKF